MAVTHFKEEGKKETTAEPFESALISEISAHFTLLLQLLIFNLFSTHYTGLHVFDIV